jgi:dextranase
VKITDFFPNRGHFAPGTEVEFLLELESGQPGEINLVLEIFSLPELVFAQKKSLQLAAGKNRISLSWAAPNEAGKGYGANVKISQTGSEGLLDSARTAFDVLESWTDFPRYGFLSDFQQDRLDARATIQALVPFHINGLQFYDWQYRHDDLISPTEVFTDPLGRELSIAVVKELIENAHEYGMAAMPYLAVYAASIEFWKEHQDWGMFDAAGNPHTFEGFLGLMDPSPNSPWTKHLINQCALVESQMNFDGFHVDQYGEPKQAYQWLGTEIDIPHAFAEFINSLKVRPSKPTVLFNAVGNWPIEALAESAQDFMYIEVWPPTPTYRDLEDIVIGAREKSGGKPVVIAQYLHADQPANIRLSNAIIMACGGTRIELGEHARLLADPYFPKHEAISPELVGHLRKMSDFVVRYGELVGPAAKNPSALQIEAPEGISVICRETSTFKTINLINFSGLDDPKWTETHAAPTTLEDFQIEVELAEQVKRIYWASPDVDQLDLQPCSCRMLGSVLTIDVPVLHYWTMIVIEIINLED